MHNFFLKKVIFICLTIGAIIFPLILYLHYYGIGELGRNIGSLRYIKIAQALVDWGYTGYRMDRLIDILNHSMLYVIFRENLLQARSLQAIVGGILYVGGLAILSKRLIPHSIFGNAVFLICGSWFVYWDAQIVYEAFQTNTLLTILFVYYLCFLTKEPQDYLFKLDKLSLFILTTPITDKLIIMPMAKVFVSSYFAVNILRPIIHMIAISLLFILIKDTKRHILIVYLFLLTALFLSDLIGLFFVLWTIFYVLMIKLESFRKLITYISIISTTILILIIFNIISIPDINYFSSFYSIQASPEILFQNRLKSLLFSSQNILIIFISLIGSLISLNLSLRNSNTKYKIIFSTSLILLLLAYFSPEGWLSRFRIFFSPFIAYGFAEFWLVVTQWYIPHQEKKKIICYITILCVFISTSSMLAPPLIQKFDPKTLCQYEKYTFYEPELYQAAKWIRDNTFPSSVIISDWETMSFISSIANRPSPVGSEIWRFALNASLVTYLNNIEISIRNRDSTLLKEILSNIPMVSEEKQYFDYLQHKLKNNETYVYLIISRNTIQSRIGNYAATCVSIKELPQETIKWLLSLSFLKMVYSIDSLLYIFSYDEKLSCISNCSTT